MLWENKGVAPLYWDYSVQIKFERVVSNIVIKWTSEPIISMKGFLPGEKEIVVEVAVPPELPEGEYDILLSVQSNGKEYQHPNPKYIKPAIKNPSDPDRWYKISRVRVLKK